MPNLTSIVRLYNTNGDLLDTHEFDNPEQAIFAIPRLFLLYPKVQTIQAGDQIVERDALKGGTSG